MSGLFRIGILADYGFPLTPSEGIGVFVYNLAFGLVRLSEQVEVCLFFPQGGRKEALPLIKDVPPRLHFIEPGDTQQPAQPYLGSPAQRHPLHTVPCAIYLIPFVGTFETLPQPNVLLVHDLVFFHFPDAVPPEVLKTFQQIVPERVREATVVGCMANFIRDNDLLGYLHLPEDRICVVRPAPPADLPQLSEDEVKRLLPAGLSRPFLFYPAAFRSYKNHRILVEALHLLYQQGHTDLDLVFTGIIEPPADLQEAIVRSGLTEHIHILRKVGRDTLSALYRVAFATVVPSLYEQGSFPVYEAIQCGCPVACADIPSLREQSAPMGEAMIYLDPQDAEAIARAVLHIDQHRDRVIAEQRETSHVLWQRTWDDVARDWLGVFHKVSNQVSPHAAAGEPRRQAFAPLYPPPMRSYAQNGEDVYLRRIFPYKKNGFYIDIGANDPVIDSVTKYFYDEGWSGINIEPGEIFCKVQEARPRDLNLNVGISDSQQQLCFYDFGNGLSTFSDEVAEGAGIEGYTCHRSMVPVTTLEAICEQYVDREIDFLSIDVEGHELQVLRGADFQRWRPRIVVIEATRKPEEWAHLLESAGYLLALFDGINRYYVREEDQALCALLSDPVNCFDNFTPHRCVAPLEEMITHYQVSYAALEEKTNQLEALHAQTHQLMRTLQDEVARYQATVQHYQTSYVALEDKASRLEVMHADALDSISRLCEDIDIRDQLISQQEHLLAEREQFIQDLTNLANTLQADLENSNRRIDSLQQQLTAQTTVLQRFSEVMQVGPMTLRCAARTHRLMVQFPFLTRQVKRVATYLFSRRNAA
jgi:FkbM family methyltransferase